MATEIHTYYSGILNPAISDEARLYVVVGENDQGERPLDYAVVDSATATSVGYAQRKLNDGKVHYLLYDEATVQPTVASQVAWCIPGGKEALAGVIETLSAAPAHKIGVSTVQLFNQAEIIEPY